MRERSDVFPGLGALSHFTPSPTSTKSLTEFLINARIYASCYELFLAAKPVLRSIFNLRIRPQTRVFAKLRVSASRVQFANAKEIQAFVRTSTKW